VGADALVATQLSIHSFAVVWGLFSIREAQLSPELRQRREDRKAQNTPSAEWRVYRL
jgi:hypothetical protein